jgi:hypothetical protein
VHPLELVEVARKRGRRVGVRVREDQSTLGRRLALRRLDRHAHRRERVLPDRIDSRVVEQAEPAR